MYYGIDAICLKNVYKLYMSLNSIPKFCFWANYRQKDAQRTFQNEHTNHRHSLEQGVAVDKIGGRACQTPKKEYRIRISPLFRGIKSTHVFVVIT